MVDHDFIVVSGNYTSQLTAATIPLAREVPFLYPFPLSTSGNSAHIGIEQLQTLHYDGTSWSSMSSGVTDGMFTVYDDFTITVQNTNDPPLAVISEPHQGSTLELGEKIVLDA